MLNTAIVGLGTVSEWHRRALDRTPGVTLTAVADVDGERTRRVADAWGVAGYEDTTALLDGEALDWVHVCTPVGSHADVGERVVRAGVHALIEKPATETHAAYESLVAAADDNGVRATVVHNQVYYPPIQTALRWIEEGRLGRSHGVSIRWLEGNDPRNPDRGDWVLDLPGGEFGEGVVHPLYVALRTAGYPASESAVHIDRINTTGDSTVVYDGVAVSYRTADEVTCTVQHHSNVTGSRQVEVIGEGGRLVADVPTQSVRYHPHGYGPKTEFSRPMVAAAYWTVRNAARAVGSVATVYARQALASARGETFTVHDTHTPVVRREARAIRGQGDGPTPRAEADWTNRLFAMVNETR
jgi:predicted dehydrogenase